MDVHMPSKTAWAVVVALLLILLPEPVTTATGTLLGFAILAGAFTTGSLPV